MHQRNIVTAGKPMNEATRALIMIHGRGGSAEDILSLAQHLNVNEYALAAPQATNNTWYPYSFIAPVSENEPWLGSALEILNSIEDELVSSGITADSIYFLGFSQGACLALEYTARNAKRYGGIVAFTGGLIGDKLTPSNYSGDFAQTPVFIGSSDPDFHVPVERVYASSNIFRNLNAQVTEKIYPNMGHTIIQDEILNANSLIFTS